MRERPASPQSATWLGWLPLPSLVLAPDGSAVEVNTAWARLTPHAPDGQGWLDAVEPEFRAALAAVLRLAAATAKPGSVDCQLAGPGGGRRSRWWWRPLPAGGLVVCAAPIDGQAPLPPAAAGGEAADPPAGPPARQGTGMSAELTEAVVQRIFRAGLLLTSAASLLDGPAADRVLHAVNELDDLIRDIRDEVFRAAPPDPGH